MKRWNDSEYIDIPEINIFIKDIVEVCKKHKLSISHEDGHGAFMIEEYNEYNIHWLEDAHDNRK